MNKLLAVPSWEWFITFLASFLIWLLLGGLIILWLVDGQFKKKIALRAFLAFTLAWVVSEMLKNLIPTVRPFRLNGFPPLTITIPGVHSFPSGHTAASFALAFSVWRQSRKLGLAFCLGALLVGLGRILANVHYLVDVLGGALLGIGCSYLLDRFFLLRSSSSKGK